MRADKLLAPFFVLFSLGSLVLATRPPAVRPATNDQTLVRDLAGRRVPLRLPTERVLMYAPVLPGYITIANSARSLLAASQLARSLAATGPFRRVHPEVENIAISGATLVPDPEQVLALHPGLVLVWSQFGQQLEEIGTAGLVELNVNLVMQPQHSEMALLAGRLTGETERASALLERRDAKLSEVEHLAAAGGREAPTVVGLSGNRGALFAGGRNYYFNQRLRSVHARNIAENMTFGGPVTLEQLLVLNPDFIILPWRNQGPDPKELYRAPEWQSLRAVRERRVYQAPEFSSWNDPVEDPLLAWWLAEVLHPEMPRRLRAEYRESYWTVYRYPIGEDEIDEAIQLEANSDSRGYRRFAREAEKALP
jgi:iron complex transport system substrate-binding protein